MWSCFWTSDKISVFAKASKLSWSQGLDTELGVFCGDYRSQCFEFVSLLAFSVWVCCVCTLGFSPSLYSLCSLKGSLITLCIYCLSWCRPPSSFFSFFSNPTYRSVCIHIHRIVWTSETVPTSWQYHGTASGRVLKQWWSRAQRSKHCLYVTFSK